MQGDSSPLVGLLMEQIDKLKRENGKLQKECNRVRYLFWHRHYNKTLPLTDEEKEVIIMGAPPESNA